MINGFRRYFLLNGKEVQVELQETKTQGKHPVGLVTILGDNTSTAARGYGYMCPYTNMTYGVSVSLKGSVYIFEFKNVLAAEGFAIVSAFSKDKKELDDWFANGEQLLIGYAVNHDIMWRLEDMDKCEF